MPRVTRRAILRWTAAVAAAAAIFAGGFALRDLLVREGLIRYNRFDRRERGTLKVGDAAPDLLLAGYATERVQLSELWRERPVVLIFGSCT
jgi:hypothetical protein